MIGGKDAEFLVRGARAPRSHRPKDAVEGRFGVFRNYIRTETPYWDALLGELGSRFPLLATHGFKVWPACGYTRAPNAGILKLRQQHDLRAEDVERLTIIGGNLATQQLCEPIERKRRPETSIDGKFSIPFTSAVMMVHGNVRLRDYTPDALRDPAVLAMADRVEYRPEQMKSVHAAGDYSSASKPTVEIHTRDGNVLKHQADRVPGDAKTPVELEFLEAKFRDCVSFSAKPIAKREYRTRACIDTRTRARARRDRDRQTAELKGLSTRSR
jgi:2-methylcitrate dehydratase PrpD